MKSFIYLYHLLVDSFLKSIESGYRLKLSCVGLILCVPLLAGCQDSETPLEPGSVVSLNRIPENPNYASLPLIGTKWKLIGFADEKTGNIRLAMPVSSDNYTLIFERDGTLGGQTSTNIAYGRYSLTNNLLLISNFSNITEINELFEGSLYIEVMNKVSSLKISSKGLSLNYDDGKFLLFKPLE
jgi:hypothetical protein